MAFTNFSYANNKVLKKKNWGAKIVISCTFDKVSSSTICWLAVLLACSSKIFEIQLRKARICRFITRMITSASVCVCMHDKSWLDWRRIVRETVGRQAYRWFYGSVPFTVAVRFNVVKGLLLGEQAPLLLCTSSLFPFVRTLIRFVDREERERLGSCLGPVSPRFCRRLPRIKLNRRYERKFRAEFSTLNVPRVTW